jgi:hypothetical protein
MKYILFLSFFLISFTSFGQMRFRLPDTRVLTDLNGGVIDRGDEFNVFVVANGNNDALTRQLLFDIQFDQTNFDLLSITHVSNGGILPANSNPQISFQNYPGYGYAGSTTNTNGTTRYQTAGYSFNAGSSNSIIRAILTWSSNSGVSNTTNNIIAIRFRIKPTSTANSFNPVRLNFVAAWNGQGSMIATTMD